MSNPTITAKAVIEPYEQEGQRNLFKVSADWSAAGVDRPISSGMVVNGKKLAERLARAIEDGVACTYRGILTDVNGKTYVDQAHNVMARRANADLTRLGY